MSSFLHMKTFVKTPKLSQLSVFSSLTWNGAWTTSNNGFPWKLVLDCSRNECKHDSLKCFHKTAFARTPKLFVLWRKSAQPDFFARFSASSKAPVNCSTLLILLEFLGKHFRHFGHLTVKTRGSSVKFAFIEAPQLAILLPLLARWTMELLRCL